LVAVQCVQINGLRDAALHRFALVIQTRFVHPVLAAAAEVAGGWWLVAAVAAVAAVAVAVVMVVE
jgi:hypothetical protein